MHIDDNGNLINSEGEVVLGAPKPFYGCTPDEKHPYIVFIVGVPCFAASSKIPDRVKMMIGRGLPSGVVVTLDTRSGELYRIGD